MGNTALDLDAIETRCEAARCEINRLCLGTITWTMSIPVRSDDTDIVLTDSFRDIPALVTRVKRLRRELHDERVRRDEWEKMYNQAVTGTEAERLRVEVEQLQARLAKLRGKLTEKGKSINRFEAALASTQGYLKETRADLAQALEELSTVDEALGEFYCPVLDPETDEPCGSYWKDHGVNMMRQALDVALQAAQDQSDEVQELWLSPCEAEGLRRQLARAQMQAVAPKKAVEWLWGFWDGNTLVAKPGCEDAIREAWDKLLMAVDSIAGDALLEQLAEAETTVRIHEHALDKRDKALAAERQLRWEAEHYVNDCRFVLTGVRKALDECQVEGKYDADAVMRIRWLNQRAERAEALAALVNEGAAKLLEKLASHTRAYADNYANPLSVYVHLWRRDAEDADGLAARIREVLSER